MLFFCVCAKLKLTTAEVERAHLIVEREVVQIHWTTGFDSQSIVVV